MRLECDVRGKVKEYDHSKLKDLQSRLTLVAGAQNSKEHIETFDEVSFW